MSVRASELARERQDIDGESAADGELPDDGDLRGVQDYAEHGESEDSRQTTQIG